MAVKKTATTAETKTKAEPKKTELMRTEDKKTELKKIEPKKAEPKKEEPKKVEQKAEPKKTESKKPATKKKTAVKKEIKVNAIVEYQGRQVDEKTMIAAVKNAWTKAGNKVGDIKTLEIYIKPEEDSVYYVINGTETGQVAF